jgi:hypothetical protein
VLSHQAFRAGDVFTGFVTHNQSALMQGLV